MIVFYKNYKRSERTYLSIQSLKHFFPNVDVRCLFLYDENPEEYYSDILKFESIGVTCYLDIKKYNFPNLTSFGNKINGFYFTEGINKIQKIMNDLDGKLLVVDEDSYFTNGETIKFLLNEECDLAFCNWPSPDLIHKIGINGSILSFNPKILNHFFPLPEKEEYIEDLLGVHLYDRCVSENFKVIKIPTRDYNNYFGDGTHTNDISEIKDQLIKHKIKFTEL